MRQQTYKDELDLQTLLEQHPKILAGDLVDSTNPRRWLLITREMGIPGESGANDRWSVDHLFVDQDGIPAFVEVKRSTDTRIRREVVGQMLDYAANALAYWPINRVRETFEARAGDNATFELEQHLNPGDTPEQFWERVKTHFDAERIRLVFVSDAIPQELKVIIEFLNRQMDPTEVIGVEVPQFIDEQTRMRTIVPHLIGPTAQSTIKKASVRAIVDHSEESFWIDARNAVESALTLKGMEDLIASWRDEKLAAHTVIWWARNALLGLPGIIKKRALLGLSRNGRLWVSFDYWTPRWRDVGERQIAARIEIEKGIEKIFDITLSESQKRGSPSFLPKVWMPRIAELQSLVYDVSVKYADKGETTDWGVDALNTTDAVSREAD